LKTYIPVASASVTAAANLTKNRFIGFTGNHCAAGAKAIGTTTLDVDSGEQASVVFCGIVLVEAGAAVAVGAEVTSDAQGRAVPVSANARNGWALDAATAAGEIIRVMLD